MLKILLGGSPCTHWSIAQRNDSREKSPCGVGWDLFTNYQLAKEKFKPDLFLYENNKSADESIKREICNCLGTQLMYINSALVSAQNRERFYVFNWEADLPTDRGILLKDILVSETGQNLSCSEKSYCLTATYGGATPKNTIERKQRTMIAEPIRIGSVGDSKGQGNRVYSACGKSICLSANGGGRGAKTGLYAVPTAYPYDMRNHKVYRVVNGEIEIGGTMYPTKLSDDNYIIRKLTPIECERLQTLPDNYTQGVSNSQRYKMLGNGWTAEVIIHLLKAALKNIPRNTKLFVLSLYDGMGTGRYCLDKLGFTNVTYLAYEIDRYAISVAKKNYPDIVECGNANAVKSDYWDWRCDMYGRTKNAS